MIENITEILFNNAELFPNKSAIIHKCERISYKQLTEDVKRYSAYLIEKGLRKGDNILIFVPMSIELYKILIATFNIGAVAVFVDAWATKNRLSQALEIVPCKAFIGCPKAFILKLLSKKINEIPLNIISGIDKFKPKNKDIQFEKGYKSDTALITFTTGSTGIPKAAKRTHEFLLEQHYVLKKHLNPEISDIDLTTMPIFALHNLACGITSVIPNFDPRKPADIEPAKILNEINELKINTTAGSPMFYDKLAQYCISKSKMPKTLEKIFLGGAPVFPKLAKTLNKAFPKTHTEIVFGSTEAEPMSSISTTELLEYSGSLNDGLLVGKPIDDINIKIIQSSNEPIEEADFEKLWLNKGEIGEIVVEGKHVLKEYFNSPEAQRFAKIKYKDQIWHRTGDAGYIDENGNLFLMGRIKNKFEKDGKEYYVFPIENLLLEIEGIEIGTIMKHNNKVLLLLELKKSYKNKKQQIEESIKSSKIIYDEIILLDKIPRDPRHNSKIDYDKVLSKL